MNLFRLRASAARAFALVASAFLLVAGSAFAQYPNKTIKLVVPYPRGEDLTEIAVVIDRSGSMEAIRTDAIGGFNAFLAQQQAEPGELRMTIVLFNHEIETIHARLPAAEVPPLRNGDTGELL